MTIPVTELARRICIARHPFRGQTGATIPCGEDTRTAQLSYGLTDHGGSIAFQQIEKVRIEAGLQPNLAELLEDGVEAFRLTREWVGFAELPAEPGWSWFDWTERVRRTLHPDAQTVSAAFDDILAVVPTSEAELAQADGEAEVEGARDDSEFDHTEREDSFDHAGAGNGDGE